MAAHYIAVIRAVYKYIYTRLWLSSEWCVCARAIVMSAYVPFPDTKNWMASYGPGYLLIKRRIVSPSVEALLK